MILHIRVTWKSYLFTLRHAIHATANWIREQYWTCLHIWCSLGNSLTKQILPQKYLLANPWLSPQATENIQMTMQGLQGSWHGSRKGRDIETVIFKTLTLCWFAPGRCPSARRWWQSCAVSSSVKTVSNLGEDEGGLYGLAPLSRKSGEPAPPPRSATASSVAGVTLTLSHRD